MNNIRFLRAVLWPSLRPYFSSPSRLVRLPVRAVRLLRMHGLRGLRDALVQRATMNGTIQLATNENFDEQAYLRTNPDVAAAVEKGAELSGRAHFEKHGHKERRLLRPFSRFTKPHRIILPENYPFKHIVTEISANDDMFISEGYAHVSEGEAHYLGVGLSALNNIETAISKRGLAKVRTILDMPCGYGRVTRVLRVAYPDTDCPTSAPMGLIEVFA